MTHEQIIKVLKDEHSKTGISFEGLGKKTGVSGQTISNTLNGANHPSLPTLLDICDALGLVVEVKPKSKH